MTLHAFNPAAAEPVLTLPPSEGGVLSIRAKALLFHDPRSVALLEHVERIARSEASVLIIGDTGTGKELIARHLHTRSGRRGPFVAVNCGAFSENLIDAELFGHETGAFTGASQSRAGWFEAANGGTLFLDEIGDLPLSLQVKLLRVLQERQVVRLGSRKPIPLDVRLVAATNVDLRQAVEAQRFRADLYYRLNVAPVTLPPLRERTGDILPLARHFMGVYAPRLGLSHVTLAPETETALVEYLWPGNIRELENVVHFALVICRDGVVRPGDLRLVAPVLAAPARPAVVTEPELPVPAPASVPERSPYADLEDNVLRLIAGGDRNLFHAVTETVVRTAFLQANENQVRAARVLGITRNTLRTFLKRYGMLAASPRGADGHDDDTDDGHDAGVTEPGALYGDLEPLRA
jgi:sigma-54-specific transcriptional regulator